MKWVIGHGTLRRNYIHREMNEPPREDTKREETGDACLLDDPVAAAERSLKEGQVGRIEGEDAVQ